MNYMSQEFYNRNMERINKYLKPNVELSFVDKYNLMVEINDWFNKTKIFISLPNLHDLSIEDLRKFQLKSMLTAELLKFWFCNIEPHRCYKKHYIFLTSMSKKLMYFEDYPLMKQYLCRIKEFDKDLMLIHIFACNLLKYQKLYFKNIDRKKNSKIREKRLHK